MSIKYECNRCHKQFCKDDELTRVEVFNKNVGTMVYHYCWNCDLYYYNALKIVNDKIYNGSLYPTDTIGRKIVVKKDETAGH